MLSHIDWYLYLKGKDNIKWAKRNTIATYESGRNISIDAIISLICREFNINEECLKTGKNIKEQPEPKNELDKLAEKYNMGYNYSNPINW